MSNIDHKLKSCLPCVTSIGAFTKYNVGFKGLQVCRHTTELFPELFSRLSGHKKIKNTSVNIYSIFSIFTSLLSFSEGKVVNLAHYRTVYRLVRRVINIDVLVLLLDLWSMIG